MNARALQERLGGEWRKERERSEPVDHETWLASMPLLRDWTTSTASDDEAD